MSRRIVVAGSFRDVPADAWDALVGDAPPFLEHAFLRALEETGCAVAQTGWEPRPVLVYEGNELVAAAPCWKKTHSMGEFVYDHGWASGAERAGLSYYPKLVVAVPFTPVSGERLLVKNSDPDHRAALLAGITEAGRDCRAVHVLFDTPDEAARLQPMGFFPRIQWQYWWRNAGYRTYEDFLGRFPSKHRNKLRHERKSLSHLRFEVVDSPPVPILDALHSFYANTTDRHVWGQQYLTKAFFRRIGETWGKRIVAVCAYDGDRLVAGAWNAIKGDRLYGRTWGCVAEIPFLHFEVCYYQGIETAIARGCSVFEPGHGGEHKYKRGFEPEVTWSSHRFVDPRLQRAFADYSNKEATAVRREVESLKAESPMRPV